MDKTELNRQTALRFVAAMGANDPHTAGDCMAPDSVAVATVNDLVALSVLVLEVPFSASQLADRHRADVIVDDVGRLAVPLPIARRILDEHRRSIERTAAVRDERRQRAGEAHTANVAATRAKLHRRARAQAQPSPTATTA